MLQRKSETPDFILVEPEYAPEITAHSHVGLRLEVLHDGAENWTLYREIGNYTIVGSSMFAQEQHPFMVPALPDRPREFYIGEGEKQVRMADSGPRVIDLRECYGEFADSKISGIRFVIGSLIET